MDERHKQFQDRSLNREDRYFLQHGGDSSAFHVTQQCGGNNSLQFPCGGDERAVTILEIQDTSPQFMD